MIVISPTDFDSIFPEKVRSLFQIISREGYGLTLVGGSVRDYLLTGDTGKDLDFELRHTFEFRGREWEEKIARLGERLKSIYQYEVESLPFSILRVPVDGYDIELSSPRLEKYKDQEVYKHSDFDVELVSNLSYEDSFKRRDFTINAIAIEFGQIGDAEEFKLIDPYCGQKDLENKVLKNCNENCFKDPVRFLRAIRFSLKYDLKLDNLFEKSLAQFNLSLLTDYYFFNEAFKSKYSQFISCFFDWVEKYEIQISTELKALSFLGESLEGNYKANEDVLFSLALKGEAREHLEAFIHYANLKSQYLNSLMQLKPIIESLQQNSLNELIALSLESDFGEGEVPKELKLIKTLQSSRELAMRLTHFLPSSFQEEWKQAIEFFPAKIPLTNRAEIQLKQSTPVDWKPFITLYYYLSSLERN